MYRKNLDLLLFLDELCVPKRHRETFSEIVGKVSKDEILKTDIVEDMEGSTLPYIRIRTTGKGNRETFIGYEEGTLLVMAVRNRYAFVYDNNKKEFSRVLRESNRIFIVTKGDNENA